ncbi:MAG: hypothetical protein LBT89_08850 [Planctomycetaceae bacterium]|jgi:hypothetical protein|nr:hypothetical protein [Planctomycetaceae bacterium]
MMDRWQHALTQNDTDFKELFGVKKEVFHKMPAVLTSAYQREHKNGGRAAKSYRSAIGCCSLCNTGVNTG